MAVIYNTKEGNRTALDRGDFVFLMSQLRKVAKARKREKLLNKTELGREILRQQKN